MAQCRALTRSQWIKIKECLVKAWNLVLILFVLLEQLPSSQSSKPPCLLYKEYIQVAANGTITCPTCPLCENGTGLVHQCGKQISQDDRKACETCPTGKFNDRTTPAAVTCIPCNQQDNRVVLKECTPSQDREYGPCIKHFYYKDGEDRCTKCSCCTSGNSKVVEKCKNDGSPANMQCEDNGQECPIVISPSPVQPMIQSSTMVQNQAFNVTTSGDQPEPGEIIQKSGQGISYWMRTNVMIPGAVVVVLVLLSIGSAVTFFVVYKHRRVSGFRENHKDIELAVVKNRSADPSAKVGDIASDTDSQQPLLSDGPNDASTGEFLPLVVHREPCDSPDIPDKVYFLPNNITDCCLSKMPTCLKLYLRVQLDQKKPGKKNCLDVARAFGLSEHQLEVIQVAGQNLRGSETKTMFTELESRGDKEPSLQKLLKVLISLDRKDIVDNWDWKTNNRKKIVVETCEALNNIKGNALVSKNKTSIEELEENAQLKGYQLRSDNPGGGNCMFYALLNQLQRFGNHEMGGPQMLREKLVQYLEQNPRLNNGTELFEFVDGYSSWGDYLAEMRRNGTWGDHLVLLAAANVFQRQIIVITSLSHNEETMIDPVQISAEQVSDEPIVLGHIVESHYISLEPRPDCPLSESDCPLSEMPHPLKEYLCVQLDINKPYQANCHDIAQELGFSIDNLKALELEDRPTERLLDMLEARTGKMTVNDLVNVLIEVGRRDIVDNWDWATNTRKQRKIKK